MTRRCRQRSHAARPWRLRPGDLRTTPCLEKRPGRGYCSSDCTGRRSAWMVLPSAQQRLPATRWEEEAIIPVCRTIVRFDRLVADGAKPSFPTAMGRLLKGETFATSGPLLFLSVNGKGPGMDIESYRKRAARRDRASASRLRRSSVQQSGDCADGKVVAEWHSAKPAVPARAQNQAALERQLVDRGALLGAQHRSTRTPIRSGSTSTAGRLSKQKPRRYC